MGNGTSSKPLFHPPPHAQPVQPARSIGQPPPQYCRATKALLIGINYEGTSAQLRGCQNDAQDIYDLLTRNFGYDRNNIRVMMDGRGKEFPSRQNILKNIKWLVSGAQPGDCLFFHYSGHGGQQEDPNCAEEDCMDETILPADFQRAGQIIDDELFEAMVRPLPDGVRLVAVMDCCHSGTGLDLPYTYQDGQSQWYGMSMPTGYGYQNVGWHCDDNPYHSEGNVLLFSGCMDEQTSADVQAPYSKPRGAMTEAFIQTVERNRSRTTYKQFLQGLRQNLSRAGHSQYPQLTSSQKFDIEKPFEVVGGICPNMNPQVGRAFTKRKHPKSNWLNNSGDPLGNMLFPDVDPFCLMLLCDIGCTDSFELGGLDDLLSGFDD
mmetsp:Transcript_43591/g.93341  ORF Transcript_43591/g.93341 Transcript_43591/m.93341 type:complete len:376 (-) Transcript_43591:81-1208(-)|eukprot:CAMPEP_0206429382 /NCGR_PEP_ID=MMETSP0324_2-20121206/6208_1 /ASSEMBLY_ACC=CAM_ASM_000836 /TAXON_ID=2866 /ORGANISM="Crypthecodinium cohnii, Strain Seligo" /LENGTH=375 /DNA_ID=CAMNT_0053895053 /DNA_START=170 /DNA_END=1297 /DNA_ORIENTATION=+